MRIKNILGATICIANIAISVISCKTTKPTATTTAPVPIALTYNNVVKNIINENCLKCHGAGKKKGDFTSYLGVKEKIDDGSFHKLVIEKKTMPPPKEPLSNADFTKIKEWLEAGAPEK